MDFCLNLYPGKAIHACPGSRLRLAPTAAIKQATTARHACVECLSNTLLACSQEYQGFGWVALFDVTLKQLSSLSSLHEHQASKGALSRGQGGQRSCNALSLKLSAVCTKDPIRVSCAHTHTRACSVTTSTCRPQSAAPYRGQQQGHQMGRCAPPPAPLRAQR